MRTIVYENKNLKHSKCILAYISYSVGFGVYCLFNLHFFEKELNSSTVVKLQIWIG